MLCIIFFISFQKKKAQALGGKNGKQNKYLCIGKFLPSSFSLLLLNVNFWLPLDGKKSLYIKKKHRSDGNKIKNATNARVGKNIKAKAG